MLTDARKLDGWKPEHELRAVLAVRFADLADRAARDGDGPGMTRAASQLLEVVDRLPIPAPAGGEPVGNDGGRANVIRLLDSPPAVGD